MHTHASWHSLRTYLHPSPPVHIDKSLLTCLGGEGEQGEADPSIRPKALTLVEIGKTQWPADACCFVIDVCLNGKATGGREPRIISLASSHVSPDGTVLSTFHRYVKTDVSADAAMVSNVHGLDYLTLQAKANGKTFSEVGAEWVTWLRQRLNGATRAVLVTAGGLKTNAYTSLLARLFN